LLAEVIRIDRHTAARNRVVKDREYTDLKQVLFGLIDGTSKKTDLALAYTHAEDTYVSSPKKIDGKRNVA